MSNYSIFNAHIFARGTKQILKGICYFFAEKILGGLGGYPPTSCVYGYHIRSLPNSLNRCTIRLSRVTFIVGKTISVDH